MNHFFVLLVASNDQTDWKFNFTSKLILAMKIPPHALPPTLPIQILTLPRLTSRNAHRFALHALTIRVGCHMEVKSTLASGFSRCSS